MLAMTDQPNPSDYLQGRTAQCYRSGCLRRLQNKDDVICYLCQHAEENPDCKEEFKTAKNAPTNKWYFLWTFPRFVWESAEEVIICKCCEAKAPAVDFGHYKNGVYKSFIAHCPRTKSCKAAAAYWGKDTDEPLAALNLFKARRAAAIEEAAHFPSPINVHLAEPADPEPDLSNFADEDFIDLHPPRLQRSKPINVPKK